MATPKNAPANAKKPADHQTAKQDVENQSIDVDWHGHTYVIETELVNDLEVLEAFEQNYLATGLRRMLGDDQYQAFKDNERNDGGRISLDSVNEFLEQVQKVASGK